MTVDHKKVRYLRSIKKYRDELLQFTVIPFDQLRVLSGSETERFKSLVKTVAGRSTKKIIPLSELSTITNRLSEIQSPLLLFTPRSEDCGAYRLDGTHQFNWNFDFDANSEGIISLMDMAGKNRMAIDFYAEDTAPVVEIDLLGSDWTLADR